MNAIKKFLGIPVWGKWQLVTQDYFEEMRGMYTPYIVQKRQCEWSGKWQIEIITPTNVLHYRNPNKAN